MKRKSTSTAAAISAAIQEHGPMSSAQVSEHVRRQHIATYLSQMTRAGRLKKTGGHGGTYALAAGRGDGVDMDAATPRAKKRAGGGKRMHKKPRKARTLPIVRGLPAEQRIERKIGRPLATTRPVAALFRPAIACDGALLLTGAAKAGELNRAETRVLADFLARVDRTGVRA